MTIIAGCENRELKTATATVPTAAPNLPKTDLRSVLGPETYNLECRIPGQAPNRELFRLLVERSKLNFIMPSDALTDSKVVPPAVASVGKLLEDTFNADHLVVGSHESGFIWLMPEARANSTASARSLARDEARKLLSSPEHQKKINIRTPLRTSSKDIIPLLAQRAKIKVTVAEQAGRPLDVNVRDKPMDAVFMAVLETAGLRLRSDGKGGYVAEPYS